MPCAMIPLHVKPRRPSELLISSIFFNNKNPDAGTEEQMQAPFVHPNST